MAMWGVGVLNTDSPAGMQPSWYAAQLVCSPAGMQTINSLVNQQAATLVYLQDFRIMLCLTLAALPLIFLFKVQAQKRSAMPCADMFSQR